MKQFIHKKRRSAGMKRYRAPMGYTRNSMQWGKWETVATFDTLIEACDALKDVRNAKRIGAGSTEHQVTLGGKCVLRLDSDDWWRARQRLDKPEWREAIADREKQLRGER